MNSSGEKLGSRLGFILLSAGCAIGLGNVWKFPYIAGENGGGIFLLLYLVILVIFGIPIMTMEFSIGRASQKPPVKMYYELEPEGTKWHFHGYIGMFGTILLMMYYSVVVGWIINYFLKFLMGRFENATVDVIEGQYADLLSSPGNNLLFLAIVVILGFGVCAIGLQNGLEKITKYLMVTLLLIMVVLCVKAFTMPGFKEGLRFFLYPDWEKARTIGIGKVAMAALNQAFFTLSIGGGSMAVFGSYINKDRRLLGESVHIMVLDTFVAVTAGLVMFPTCFSYGIRVDSGPGLLFVTMPNVFANMPLGRVWGSLFFLFMSFAALSTAFAVYENIIANFMGVTGIDRKKACLICGIGIFILSVPCALGTNLLSFFKPFGGNSSVLDLEDFLVSNLILPIGSIIFVLFCTTKKGWGWDNFLKEANTGNGLAMPGWLKYYMKFFAPIVLIVILVVGLIDFLK